jgi:predicted short-subunit dehydrogenase-like oxidoreductase (DUF2520 family)
MTFDIIGTGNTAWFMGTRLVAAGHTCMGVYGRNVERAAQLADALTTKVYPELTSIPDTSDCCIIAISDYAINEVVAQLYFNRTTLIHTAGAVGIDVLSRSANQTGVIWPVYSILKTDLPQHRSIPLVWESNNDAAQKTLLQLVNSISDITHETDSEKRKWLHLTAVLGNNFTNHLFSICEQLCSQQQVPFELLYPIIAQMAERIHTQSPAMLQTGPARRNDVNTMQKQMDMLAANPLWQQVYKVLSASIENMYKPNAEEKGAKR